MKKATSKTAGRKSTGGVLRIILAENDETAVSQFRQAFKRGGLPAEITVCKRAQETLDLVRSTAYNFDILVTDHQLPDFTGLELCLDLIEYGVQLPKVLLAGAGSENLAVIALKSGVDDYIIKDPRLAYLDLLPVVLPVVVRAFQNRLARGQAEEALRASEEKYRILVESEGEGVTIVDLDEHFIFANAASEQIFGVPPGTLIGKAITEFVTPDQLEIIHRQTNLRRQNLHSVYEHDIVRPSGEKRTVLVTATPRLNKRGKAIGTFSVFRDITEAKTMERALRESEARYRILFENAGVGITVISREGRFLLINSAAASKLGGDPETLTGKSFADIFPEEMAQRYTQSIARVITEGKEAFWENCVELPAGRVWLRSSVFPIRNEDGKIESTLVVAQDITQHKEAELALLDSEHRFREFANLMPQIFFELDEKGDFACANRYALEFSGYTQEDIQQGLSVFEMVALEDKPRAFEIIQRVLGGETISGEDFSAVKRDGTKYHALLYATPIVKPGRNAGIRGVIVDITKRVEAEKEQQRLIIELQNTLAKPD